MGLVSIIMKVRNDREHVRLCLKTLKAQRWQGAAAPCLLDSDVLVPRHWLARLEAPAVKWRFHELAATK